MNFYFLKISQFQNNTKTTIYNEQQRHKEAKAIVYLVKGLFKETHKLSEVDNFILILTEFIQK